jgi:hypothetical protein
VHIPSGNRQWVDAKKGKLARSFSRVSKTGANLP